MTSILYYSFMEIHKEKKMLKVEAKLVLFGET